MALKSAQRIVLYLKELQKAGIEPVIRSVTDRPTVITKPKPKPMPITLSKQPVEPRRFIASRRVKPKRQPNLAELKHQLTESMTKLRERELKLDSKMNNIDRSLLDQVLVGYEKTPTSTEQPSPHLRRGHLSNQVIHGKTPYFPTMRSQDIETSPSEIEIRELANEHNISIATVERMKRTFNNYDTDGSGELDIQEIRPMIAELLGEKDDALSSSKLISDFFVGQFEAGSDSAEDVRVAFPKFVRIFQRFFGTSQHPVAAFYSSLNPVSSISKMKQY